MSWLEARDGSWMAGLYARAESLQCCEQIVWEAFNCESSEDYIAHGLTAMMTELGARWIGLFRKHPQWETELEVGRRPVFQLPHSWLDEVLDREAASVQASNNPSSWPLVACPFTFRLGGLSPQVLLMAGKGLTETDLPIVMALVRTIFLGSEIVSHIHEERQAVERCQRLLRSISKLSEVRETNPLLKVIADQATQLVECDRASIFIWDKERKELVANPALGVEDETFRMPDNKGIVGECIHSGETIVVDDAYADDRFNQAVDKQTGYKTRNLICVPVRSRVGEIVGCVEGINKLEGGFTEDDDQLLQELGVHVAITLQHAKENEALLRNFRQLTAQASRKVKIIGESPPIEKLRSTIERLATTDLPVLVLGESGTGKEVVSQSLHYLSPRADHPFVAINCAALSESLLESELFGHEKGAFTDAREARQGKFELADGGTLFLDEIGDMSPGGQAKLLRVLEQKVVTRVGGSRNIPVNVRVVAATNADLVQNVQDKKFRQDLYYRLSVVTIDLPPLRERNKDIILLAEFFLEEFCRQANRKPLRLSEQAKGRLLDHHWPGNVREVRNLMERVAFLANGPVVEVEDLAFILSPEAENGITVGSNLELTEATLEFQRDYIRKAINRSEGNISEAARKLGLHRSNLYRKMRQLDMKEVNGVL